jgi:hypothetical protein
MSNGSVTPAGYQAGRVPSRRGGRRTPQQAKAQQTRRGTVTNAPMTTARRDELAGQLRASQTADAARHNALADRLRQWHRDQAGGDMWSRANPQQIERHLTNTGDAMNRHDASVANYRTQFGGGGAGEPQGSLLDLIAAGGGGGGGGGGRGRGGGGGGGAAGMDPAASFGPYADQVMNMLRSMGSPQDTMTPRIHEAVDADLAAARGAFGQVAHRTADPYAGMQFDPGSFDPGTSALLESQGVGGGAALAQQQAGWGGLKDQAALWQNFAQARSADQQAENQRWNADLGRDQAGVESQLGAQRSALLMAAQARQEQQKEQQRQQMMQAIMSILSQGWGAGADVSKVNFGGLL